MWFEKFLNTIREILHLDPLSGIDQEALSKLNPKKIYIENVRSILGVSHKHAKSLCEAAVRRGVFTRGIEVLCPDSTVVTSSDRESSLPATVICLIDESGNYEEREFSTSSLDKITFYRLDDSRTSGA
jgi:hypothetical protein